MTSVARPVVTRKRHTVRNQSISSSRDDGRRSGVGSESGALALGGAHELVTEFLGTGAARGFAATPGGFSRRSPLSAEVMLTLLLYMVADAGRRGYARLLDAFWDEAYVAGIALGSDEPVSAAAYCQARAKLDPQAVRRVLHGVAGAFDVKHGHRFRFHGRRLLAIDGTKLILQRTRALWDAFGGMSSGYHPMTWISTLFDVVSKVPLDIDIAPNSSNERAQLMRLLDRVGRDAILVLDRGFPSFDVFALLTLSQVDFVARMRTDAFDAVTGFLASGEDDAYVDFAPPKTAATRDDGPLRLRLVVTRRQGQDPCVLVTTLDKRSFPAARIREIYRLRWEIEEYYKLVQCAYFTQGQFHAQSPCGVEQEIYAQALFVAITRHLMAAASQVHDATYAEVSQKGAILAVGRALTLLALDPDRARSGNSLRRLLRRIAGARQPLRPDRHFPRRSFLPPRLWGPHGRRRTDPNHRKRKRLRERLA